MTSASTDRRQGLTSDKGIKIPVQAATTANITLSGEQTINGVAVHATGLNGYPDRVLVKNQTNPIDNGIWDVSTGQWTRSLDSNGIQDFVTGTGVVVAGGSQLMEFFTVSALNPIIPGISPITWVTGSSVVPSGQSFNLWSYMTAAQIVDSQNYIGALNTTTAFQALAAAINAAGGGHAVIPAGLYTVGSQTFAGATGLGYSYLGADILAISGCTEPVIIEFQGAKMQLASGLKFGSFNPTTGASYAPSLPFTNADYQASTGIMVEVTNCTADIQIRGSLEINGGSASVTLGGQWGDSGYQIFGYGIYLKNNTGSQYVENVYTHHNCCDGILTECDSAVDGGPHNQTTFVNVRSEYNSRNNFSWISGIGLTAIGCQFNFAGRGAFASAPQSGCDIEQGPGVVRNGLFLNCTFGGNGNTQMVSDGGGASDVHFINCEFYGTVGASIWPNNPRFHFTDCLIAGGAEVSYIAANDADRTMFQRCLFSADETFQGVPATYGSVLYDFTSQNPIFDNCSFKTTQAGVTLGISSIASYINCRMLQNGSSGAGEPNGTYSGYNIITVSTGSVNITTKTWGNGQVIVNGVVAGVAQLASGELASDVGPATAIATFQGNNGSTYQENKLQFFYQPPASGAWIRGDRVCNATASVGAPKGWICTVSGTPGTWVSEGNL